METRKRTAVIVPAYNEAGRIGTTLNELLTCGYSVIAVDDGSYDETYATAAKYPVHLLRHPFNLGQGAALQTGLEYALKINSEVIIMFDADGQHCVEDIETIANKIKSENYDAVFGSRFLGKTENMSSLRGNLVKLMTFVFNLISGNKRTDVNCGIRGFSKNAAAKIKLKQNRMAHTLEIIEQVTDNKMRFTEVPVTIKYTEYSMHKGQSLSGGMSLFLNWLLSI